MSKEEGRMTPSPVPRRQAEVEAVIEAARRLVHGAFRRDGEQLPDDARPRFSIPARPDNDDILVMEFLKSCTPAPVTQMTGPSIDRERAVKAAAEANTAYGQWMPERWLHLFLDAYEGKSR